jgi:small-conductance mechanosensitive channel
MPLYQILIIETVVVFFIVLILRKVIAGIRRKAQKKYHLQVARNRFVAKIIDIGLYTGGFFIVLAIWGVDQADLMLFFSSFIAVLGIALFAQWSMLSNVTASILLFVNHPAKIGDYIQLLDKDFPYIGEIRDIGLFFITIRTDEGEVLTIPNGLIFQRMVKIISKPKDDAQ